MNFTKSTYNMTLIQHNEEHFTIWCKFSTTKNTYSVTLIQIGWEHLLSDANSAQLRANTVWC
jgi:hypothetical protein